MPAAFVAVTEHVYVFVAVNPVTTTGLTVFDAVPVAPPSLDTQLAEKLVIAAPFAAPAVNATLKRLAPVTEAAPIVGAAGTSAAVAVADTADTYAVPDGPVP